MGPSVGLDGRKISSPPGFDPGQAYVQTVNNNSRTSNCQFGLFSKKNPIIRIFCISGWLAVPINPNKWSYNNNNIYLLQLGCHPVAVVILYVNKT